ncbi:MAG: hypothetical protein FJ315_00970 [SAR202 cluster bacterium]|nr:hypothetical protein [SAR202 cluster bacterium]
MDRSFHIWIPIASVLVVGLLLGGLGGIFTAWAGAIHSAAPVIGIGLGVLVFGPIIAWAYIKVRGPESH